MYTLYYMYIHYITCVYTILHVYTLYYMCIHYITCVYTILHVYTLYYMCIHYITCVYTILHVYTLYYMCIHYITCVYTILHVYTLLCNLKSVTTTLGLLFSWLLMPHCTVVTTLGNLASFPSYSCIMCYYDTKIMQFYY